MVSTKRKATESLQPPPTKKPRPASYKASKAVIPTAAYPWDSHQDDIVVNSVELGHKQRRVGVAHYRQQLSQQKDYQHICVDSTEYRTNSHAGVAVEEDVPELDADEQSVRESTPEPSINYTVAPDPPASRSEYKPRMYKATTRNPAVFLAVIRIAQKNLPFINFQSAITHLPNLAPTDPLPGLPEGIFVDDLAYDEHDTNTNMTMTFLPHFYADNRHALGYYSLSPNPITPSRKWATTCLFTPCTTKDLEDWEMVQYLGGRQAHGVEGMKAIGARDGQWLDQVVVEDWNDWSLGYKIVRSIWQTRLGFTMGGEEDGGRREE